MEDETACEVHNNRIYLVERGRASAGARRPVATLPTRVTTEHVVAHAAPSLRLYPCVIYIYPHVIILI